jgi:hypothetical protein
MNDLMNSEIQDGCDKTATNHSNHSNQCRIIDTEVHLRFQPTMNHARELPLMFQCQSMKDLLLNAHKYEVHKANGQRLDEHLTNSMKFHLIVLMKSVNPSTKD